MSTVLKGHCLCGAVSFEVREPLKRASYCHCTRCQRRSGAGASANGGAPPGSVHVVTGEELVTHWNPGDGGWLKEFCSVCGGQLFTRHPENPEIRGVCLGALEDDPVVRPSHRQFTADAAVWEPIPDDGLPRFPGHMTG